MRLQKFIAKTGLCSRRKAEEYIEAGKISVNGKKITEFGVKVDPKKDKVEYEGKVLELEEKKVYILLNKPKGYITANKDQFNKEAVINLVESDVRLFPVGRLDYDTSGLLILTNDGKLTYKLTHPKHNIDKVYIADVKGVPSKEEIKRFENGLNLDGFITSKADLKIVKKEKNSSTLEITIHEGKKRQVKRMCSEIGHEVTDLKRIKMGNLSLGNLKIGEYRNLTDKEVRELKKC